MPRVALLCPGLGRVHRGHESFASNLFDLLSDSLDITLFKGGGPASAREIVVPHIARDAVGLQDIKLPVSPRWHASEAGQERIRIECTSFAWAALGALLEGGFDVIHCLDRDVCNVIYAQRHLFRHTPRVLFSNGGAIPADDLPSCDFVQEHTELNLKHSVRGKAFMIPHGVNMAIYHPDIETDFRARHNIPADAVLLICVGTICFWHKRMDYVIKEIAAAGQDLHLAIVGQDSEDSPAIRELGYKLLGDRVHFDSLAPTELPKAYAAADAFVLGSIFETFGLVYIEAMAMGLPVICTNHPNQKSIVKEGVFIDMARPGALTEVLSVGHQARWQALGRRSLDIARKYYDIRSLKQQYLLKYAEIATAPTKLPTWDLARRATQNVRGTLRWAKRTIRGQSE